MTANPPKPEDRSRGQRSGEGALSALRALRRDERRRRNHHDAEDSVLPQELPPLHQDYLPRSSG
jgi:hypothetical protein